MNISELIKYKRKALGLSVKDVVENLSAKGINVSEKTIYGWESGHRQPDAETFIALADIYHISNLSNEIALFKDTNILDFPAEERSTIKKYHALDEHGKKIVNCVLDIEYERLKSSKVPQEVISNVITLPEFEQPVSAGRGVYLGDGSQTITREIQNNELTCKANFILRVSGNSMEPEFYDGDKLLVKHQPDLDIGDVGIFVLNGEGFVKKYMGDRLISLNSEYKDILLKENDVIDCKGKVIGKL